MLIRLIRLSHLKTRTLPQRHLQPVFLYHQAFLFLARRALWTERNYPQHETKQQAVCSLFLPFHYASIKTKVELNLLCNASRYSFLRVKRSKKEVLLK